MARFLMSRGIDAFLERLEADAANGVEETLVRMSRRSMYVSTRRSITSGMSCAANDGPITLPRRRVVALRPADRYLVPLGTALVDAEDADVADVVVAAGVHASRHVEVELADVVQIVEIVEAPLDRFGDRDRFRVRERAEVAARAADDVGQQADVGRRETEGPQTRSTARAGRPGARRARRGSARA